MAGERYELLERIATGGMAEVFRARSLGEHGFRKTLAIKRILPSLASDEEFVNRFIAEAKLAVALTHTNIVQIFDFGRFAGSLYIAMEFVEGGDLANLLRSLTQAGRLMTPSVALFIAIELAKGLDYAHRHAAQPVVHRDVSPSNILLSYAGEVKIADFGIAQAIEHARGVTDSRIMGKWRYMSPEQARGDAVDERSDVFSAGAVMWEMFTGRKLIPGGDAESIVKNLQEMTFVPMSALRAELPPELDDLMLKTLARDPARRLPHMLALLEALTEISYSRSVRTSSLELARLVREMLPKTDADTTVRGRGNILDDIIRSEIGVKDGSVARRTLAADGGPSGPVADESITEALRGPPQAATRPPTPAQFVLGERDERGITEWRLAGAAPSERPPSRRQSLALVAMIAGLLALTVVGILNFRGRGAPVAAPPPPPPPAILAVESTPPGAEILVDGRAVGRRTPIVDGLRLPAGEHDIEARLPGFVTTKKRQAMAAGERLSLLLALESEPRLLTVASQPSGAIVKVDGVVRGATPVEVEGLSAGAHDVLIELRGYEPQRVTLALAERGTTPYDVALHESRKFGKVALGANVAADVYVDGGRKPVCVTPCPEVPLEAGRHRLRFESPGLGVSRERVVDVKPGRTATLIVDDFPIPHR